MLLRYEVNPPKIILSKALLEYNVMQNKLSKLKYNIRGIARNCRGIHITDSVLGIPRISPIAFTSLINSTNKKIEITTSLRVRDRSITSIIQYVYDSILLKINGILVINGDEPHNKSKNFGLIPSQIIKYFRQMGITNKIDLFLSIPNNPDFNKIQKKINAEPSGFITQVISTVDQVSRIVDKLRPQGFKIIPCVLLPSIKNLKSANRLNFDWSNYQHKVFDFIKDVHHISKDVIITSPNDFTYANKIFELSRYS